MRSVTEPSGHRRSLSSAWLGLAGPPSAPALAASPRSGRVIDLTGAGATVILPDSWHLPGRHEHGRPLLPRTAGGLALSRSWS